MLCQGLCIATMLLLCHSKLQPHENIAICANFSFRDDKIIFLTNKIIIIIIINISGIIAHRCKFFYHDIESRDGTKSSSLDVIIRTLYIYIYICLLRDFLLIFIKFTGK